MAIVTVDGKVYKAGDADGAFLDPEYFQGLHADAGARQTRRGHLEARRPRAVRLGLQFHRPARARARHSAQSLHQCRRDRDHRSGLGRPHAARKRSARSSASSATLPTRKTSSSIHEVARSEAATGYRNFALANFMRSFGKLDHPVEHVLGVYFHQCALAMSCVQLAKAGLFLAASRQQSADADIPSSRRSGRGASMR